MNAWKGALSLIIMGIFGAFVTAELGMRIATDTLLVWGTPVVVDPIAGRTLRPGLSVRIPFKWFRMTGGDYGTRSNGGYRPQADHLTIAVGNSFTYGEDVGDEETWPAQLERRTGHRVINAGVAGFGLDQTVLRLEQLAPIYAPEAAVVSFIPNDVERVEMSVHAWQRKPYFEIAGGELRLHPAEVASGSPFLERIVSKSILLLTLSGFFETHAGPEFVWVHHQAREVSCLLMKRLAILGQHRGMRVVVLAQPQEPFEPRGNRELKDAVLKCAQEYHLAVLDLFPVIDSIPPPGRMQLFRPDHGHMTADGNAVVAAAVAEFLE